MSKEKLSNGMNKLVFDPDILRPYTLNKYISMERANRYIASKAKKTATNYCRAVVMQAMVDGVAFDWPCVVQFNWYLTDKRIDSDNWAFTQKFILDGMQNASVQGRKFLVNDNMVHVRGLHHDFYKTDGVARLEVIAV
ncbi:dTDP-glucose pyrophosphorylase [Convivina praedatoris]|uniref:dTDP-glucose pyrophosphorylase n=1 Tax=Convivina praedatoris TaxID=2880963 RepID=UPI00200EA5E1|nr:dTDP-glucose pyrophosphorylase [Convivina sp. LMG 32447]